VVFIHKMADGQTLRALLDSCPASLVDVNFTKNN
jgi:hypothetical protein